MLKLTTRYIQMVNLVDGVQIVEEQQVKNLPLSKMKVVNNMDFEDKKYIEDGLLSCEEFEENLNEKFES